jgi:hypothetical protein
MKKVKTIYVFFLPLFCCWFRDRGWTKFVTGIKYTGSATQAVGMVPPPIPRCLTQPLGSNVRKVEQLKNMRVLKS